MNDLVYDRLITASRVEPPRPRGFAAALPAEDAILPGDIEGAAESLAGVAMVMEYTDSKGAESRRRIVVRTLVQSGAGRVVLRCFCCERKAMRDFRVDRIRALWSITTGEVRTDIVATLGAFAVTPPALPELQAIRPLAPELTLLVHLARADGDFELEERGAIVDFIGDAVAGIDAGSRKIADHLARLYPTGDMMADALGLAVRMPLPRRQRLERHVRAVVDADGILENEEFDAIEALRQAAPRVFAAGAIAAGR